MLSAPARGCLNIHASLLPRWRGAAPIQAAVLAGDAESGVTIMQMDAGLDTGPMLLRGAVPIGPRGTAAALHDALSTLGAALILQALAEAPAPQAAARRRRHLRPQAYPRGRCARLDAARDALDRRVRALNPWPGTWCLLAGETLKVLEAIPAPGAGAPGTVLDAALTVACGSGALQLLRVQRAGRAPMEAAAFLRGHPVAPGVQLG